MKPINEYTLQECLEAIRPKTMEVSLPTHKRLAELADRIHDLTRWIPVEERLPTKDDADEKGKALWLFYGEHYESRRWDLGRDYGMTHWRKIDKL